MFAFLAAIVPIVASIYAGLSFMVEVAEHARVARAYQRIDEWYKPRNEALGLEGLQPEQHGGSDSVTRRNNELIARRSLLLRYNGINPSTNTYGHLNRLMTPSPVPKAEVHRQWVVLAGAIAGVFFLALDAIAP